MTHRQAKGSVRRGKYSGMRTSLRLAISAAATDSTQRQRRSSGATLQKLILCAISLILFVAETGHGAAISRGLDGSFTLVAENEPLESVLTALREASDAPISLHARSGRILSGTYKGATLERLLDTLGVSYVLFYEDYGSGHKLAGGGVLTSEAEGRTPEVVAAIRRHIAALRDDNIPGNAMRARKALAQFGCTASPELQIALGSDDFQTRQVAADILRSSCDGCSASDKLIEVTLELFAAGEMDYDYRWLLSESLAFRYMRDAKGEYPIFRDRLIVNLASSNPKERLISALLLAEHRETLLAGDLAGVLLPHLRDNSIQGDASTAAHALFKLGPAIRPYAEAAKESYDAQQADMVRLILHQLDNPQSKDGRPADPFFNTGISSPLLEEAWPFVERWYPDRFEEEDGDPAVIAGSREYSRPAPEGSSDDVSGGEFKYTMKVGETLE